MVDFLDKLAQDARETIDSNYYVVREEIYSSTISLKQSILQSRGAAIIAEIKAASPSLGEIRKNIDVGKIAKSMERGGAIGISVLTEPRQFKGNLLSLVEARRAVELPILMKDIILDPIQMEAAEKIGANAILLIQALFDRGYCNLALSETILRAHSKGLEVLLETHTEGEFRRAITTDADMIGINNRNLSTLNVNLDTTKRILEKAITGNKIIVSESGIKTTTDLHFLHECGVQAFLIGSAIMSDKKIQEKVKEFSISL